MSYGVKFKLEFDDVSAKQFKLEILKFNYGGSVLDLVGGENPVQIDWQSDDDIYSPIIGSTCKIQLYNTDTTNYDDFYDADEREYQVKISVKISGFFTTIWKGWLVNDTYQEVVQSNPFLIELLAIDGLGILSNYTIPFYTKSSGSDVVENVLPPNSYIQDVLNNLGLELDFYYSNELFQDGSESSNIYFSIFNSTDDDDNVPYGFMKDASEFMNAEELLKQILNFTHSRLFQSFGRWYIINKSAYSEQSIKDDLMDGSFSGASIRAAETTSLQTNGTEDIKFKKVTFTGVSSDVTFDMLYQVPSDLTPLKMDLTKQMLRPLNRATFTNSLQNRQDFLNPNPFLEWSEPRSGVYAGWDLSNSNVTFDTSEPFKTNTSFKWTGNATVTSNTFTLEKQNVGGYYKFKITYLSLSNPSGAIQYRLSGYNGTQTVYFDEANNTFNHLSVVNNQVETNEFIWVEHEIELPDITPHSSHTTYTDCKIEIIGTANDYVNVCGVFRDIFNSNLDGLYATIKADVNQNIFELTRNTGVYSAEYSAEESTLSDFIFVNYSKGDSITSVRRPFDEFLNVSKRLSEIIPRYILNDHRSFIPRYEGTFYNKTATPLMPSNKVWINFGTSVLQEPVSCYVDALSYNIKANESKVIMHIPNQDNDLGATLKQKFKS